ncbi:MAG TPA: hypothetical protein VGL62_02860 [Vicinamibacterales bacterium]|jgi:hypothetical protein
MTAEGTCSYIAYSRQAKDLGASAMMVSPPSMAKLNFGAVARHDKVLADAVDRPIVVQDYPPISGFRASSARRAGERRHSRGPAGAMDAATRRALDRVLTCVTAQKGLEWISV